MQRTQFLFQTENMSSFKRQLLKWAQDYDIAVWLDSNNYHQEYSNFDAVLAVGRSSDIVVNSTDSFDLLKSYYKQTNDYIFGYFSYDLKNTIENLKSENFDGLEFPELYFFQPQKLFLIKGNSIDVRYLDSLSDEVEPDMLSIFNQQLNPQIESAEPLRLQMRIHKDAYFEKLNALLAHIHRGDLYEANFCQEFYASNTTIDPVGVYENLNQISKPPFATFFKLRDKYLLSASPERYLMKKDSRVISQPIKGTEKRAQDPTEDKQLVYELENNPKERAENIMIVDLVRNDLSRSAEKGTVTVDELCKVYTFEQVHQLISTVSCQVSDMVHPVDLIRDTFPMGSMTGAPKISAMKIIEKLEETKRGIFSGAVGYFAPNGDFDFNVIIRSILYNSADKYVSFSVGGAITAQSDPEREYQECLLKAKAMRQVLQDMTTVS
jgi:para-aminobenzoate synthetase component 1